MQTILVSMCGPDKNLANQFDMNRIYPSGGRDNIGFNVLSSSIPVSRLLSELRQQMCEKGYKVLEVRVSKSKQHWLFGGPFVTGAVISVASEETIHRSMAHLPPNLHRT